MQQRQLRLGDILDDYCPRERRLTNHAVVAMIGDAVRQTRCTTCEAEHDYRHARIPRLRKKGDPAALSTPSAVAPKRVTHEPPPSGTANVDDDAATEGLIPSPDAAGDQPEAAVMAARAASVSNDAPGGALDNDGEAPVPVEGPVHRQLIRAQLPRQEGQPQTPRQAPDFTIRQPTGRPHRFHQRPQRGGGAFQGQGRGSNPNGNGNAAGDGRGGTSRQSGRPPLASRFARRHRGGGKPSK